MRSVFDPLCADCARAYARIFAAKARARGVRPERALLAGRVSIRRLVLSDPEFVQIVGKCCRRFGVKPGALAAEREREAFDGAK